MKKILLLLIFMICGFSWGQIAIPGTAAVTQNFTIGISATASLPTHWKMSVAGASAPTWADTGNFTATTAEASTGSPTAGGRYNWGNGTTISDRAIGFMTSGSYANPNSIMAHYQNTSGVQINDLVIAFDYERYRINTAACSITFFTSTDGFSWTARTAGDSGAFATGVSAYNYTTGTIVNRSFTLTGINIANNGNLYLRWNFNTTGGNSQGVGLDNVSLTATLASSMVAPTLTTSTATTITTTTALLGATITADGGATITSRGTVWGTTASPTGNVLAEGGTTVAAFTHSRSGFVENTLYTYRGFAVNANGTGYSPDGNFTTIHNAPNVGSGSGATSNSIIANWTAPSSGGSAVFTYEIQVDDDIAFGSPNFTQGSLPSGILSLTATGLVAATTYYFRVRATNAGGNSAWSVVSVGYATLAAPPNLTASALTGFGNVLINTLSSANSFTISGTNLTTANITLAAVTGYSYATTIGGVYSTTLSLLQTGGSFSQTIFVRFTPNALGAFNGNIVVGGGGSLNTNVAVTGTGVASATSDVSDNTDYTIAIPQANININYINFLDNSNT